MTEAAIESIANPADIAKAVTKFLHGVTLSDSEAQARWDSWCMFQRANAMSLFNQIRQP